MTDHIKIINETLEKALIEKTFTLDVIEAIKKTRDENIKLVEDNKRITEIYDIKCKEVNKLSGDLTTATSKLTNIESRESAVRLKEIENYKIEMNQEHHRQRAEEMKDIIRIIFSNPTILRSRSTNTPVNTQYGVNNYTGNENETETIMEK